MFIYAMLLMDLQSSAAKKHTQFKTAFGKLPPRMLCFSKHNHCLEESTDKGLWEGLLNSWGRVRLCLASEE